METFSVLFALCEGNSPVTGVFPSQRPVMRNFDGFLDMRLNKRLSKRSSGWWFETPSRLLWRDCNGNFSRIWNIAFVSNHCKLAGLWVIFAPCETLSIDPRSVFGPNSNWYYVLLMWPISDICDTIDNWVERADDKFVTIRLRRSVHIFTISFNVCV